MVGLARGHGKGTAGISQEEKYLIEEHDIVIFALGSFKNCILEKDYLYNDIDIPVIVTGAPEIDLEELPGVDQGLAEEIASKVGADIEQIIPKVNYNGKLGYARGGKDGMSEKIIDLETLKYDPADYDLV